MDSAFPKILLVVGTAHYSQVIREAIQRDELRVILVTAERYSPELLYQEQPQIVVVPLQEADIDGFEVMARIKSDPRIFGTAILFIVPDSYENSPQLFESSRLSACATEARLVRTIKELL